MDRSGLCAKVLSTRYDANHSRDRISAIPPFIGQSLRLCAPGGRLVSRLSIRWGSEVIVFEVLLYV